MLRYGEIVSQNEMLSLQTMLVELKRVEKKLLYDQNKKQTVEGLVDLHN